VDAGSASQIEKDMADLTAMLASSEDFQSLIRSPLLKVGVQQAALAAIADKAQLSPLTKNFLLTLAANRRLPQLDSMLKAVTDNISARRGELRAKVESAVELSSAQKKSLEEHLAKTIGHPVAVDASVNKELIGGVTITLGSLMIDDSIKTKLERMGRAMKHNGAKAA
jgi:F-type H+-transporting ATPase subunit delta